MAPGISGRVQAPPFPARARRLRRLLVGLVAVAAAALPAVPADADPIVAPGASPTVVALAEANARAEQANERAMDAAQQLPRRQGEAQRTATAAETARVAAEQARTGRDQAFAQVDALTRSSYQGGDLDQLGALLASGSPQSYLDKISLLDTVSTENKAILQRYIDASAAADGAQHDAEARATEARRASDDATSAVRLATDTKTQADRDVATAQSALDRAGAADRAALRAATTGGAPAPTLTANPTDIPGNGVGVAALRAALTRQGAPYVWGATGPNSFDCSGLVQWSFAQVGVGLPRTAAAQQQVGHPVAPSAAQPGDLVFFGSPAYHVGIYVGGGRFLEAPQSGDVVHVSPLRGGISSVERIG